MESQTILAGKTAIITGGSRGIGAAVARRFAARGARVFFTYKSGAAAAERLAAETGATAVCCDQSDGAAIESAFEKIFADTGRIDVLVNNAGIAKDSFLALMPERDFLSVLDINAAGAFRWTKLAAKKMLSQKSGSIIFMSSASGLVGIGGQANYAASKGAMCAFARAVAAELGSKGIRANSICPGFVETDMTAKIPRRLVAEYTDKIALKRFARAEEIASVALFLASDMSSYITGQSIAVDGGLTACF